MSRDLDRAAQYLSATFLRRALDAGAPVESPSALVNAILTTTRCDDDGVDVAALRAEALRVLLRRGIVDGATALTFALKALSDAPVVGAIISHGVNLKHRPGSDNSWLRDVRPWLHDVRRADIARLLIASGASVRAAHADGSTALHWAALHLHDESVPMIAVLLEEGADVNATALDGSVPLDWAIARAVHPSTIIGVVLPLLDAGALLIGEELSTWGLRQCVSDYLVSRHRSHEAAESPLVTGGWTGWHARLVRVLVRAAAWRRRRHLLLALYWRGCSTPTRGVRHTLGACVTH